MLWFQAPQIKSRFGDQTIVPWFNFFADYHGIEFGCSSDTPCFSLINSRRCPRGLRTVCASAGEREGVSCIVLERECHYLAKVRNGLVAADETARASN